MGRTIAMASGKGGVGKTTVTANLGVALAKLGKKTLVVDADIAMANLSLLFGIQTAPITLHDVLVGDAELYDAIYDGPAGVKIIPSGLSLSSYRKVEPERISSVLSAVKNEYDFILIDVPAGIGDNAMAAMSAAGEMILVVTPDPASLADALKTKMVGERLGVRPMGTIINMVRGIPGEASPDDVRQILELPVLGSIPDDNEVRRSFLMRRPQPVVLRKPDAKASRAFMAIAARLAGVAPPPRRRRGLISFIKALLHREE